MWIVQSKYSQPDFFESLEKELLALIDGEKNLIANLANLSSWLMHAIPELNWCGFYLWNKEDQELVLGPFQGLPACLRIRPGRGVCGTAYAKKETQRVDDVHEFPGHIACDASSRAELVIPMFKGDEVVAILDFDSPLPARFSDRDATELTRIIQKISYQIF